jgi:hypothetical protein
MDGLPSLPTGAGHGSGLDLPRLTPGSTLLAHARNRWLHTSLGIWGSMDPNASGQGVVGNEAHSGQTSTDEARAFDLQSRSHDGMNLIEYLGSGPLSKSDALGLYADGEYSGGDAFEDATDLMGLRSPLPGPSDFIRATLEALVNDYSENLSGDVSWASDWSADDEDHSRNDNSWIYLALGRGLHNAFDIGLPGTDVSINPIDLFSADSVPGSRSASGSGGSIRRGGHTKYTIRGQAAHLDYPNSFPPAVRAQYKFNHTIPKSGIRVDAIDFKNKVIRELKPFTPSGNTKGIKQLQKYKNILANHPDSNIRGNYTDQLDFYMP